MHLSKQIDLMSEVRAIGYVAPALDLCNAGTNDAKEEGDNNSNAAVVGTGAARAAESKGDGVGGVLLLELHATGAVEGKGGVKGKEEPQNCMKTDN
jgi:hypothetical protein